MFSLQEKSLNYSDFIFTPSDAISERIDQSEASIYLEVVQRPVEPFMLRQLLRGVILDSSLTLH